MKRAHVKRPPAPETRPVLLTMSEARVLLDVLNRKFIHAVCREDGWSPADRALVRKLKALWENPLPPLRCVNCGSPMGKGAGIDSCAKCIRLYVRVRPGP